MKGSGIEKMQAVAMVILLATSGLLLVNVGSNEVRADDTSYSGTWVIESDTTIAAGDTVTVHDVNGYSTPPHIYPAGTGVVIASNNPEQAVTLTVRGTLIIHEGDLWVGREGPPPQPGALVVDGGTIRFHTNGVATRAINGNGLIRIDGGTVQNNGTHNNGTGSNDDTFRIIANNSLFIRDSIIEDLSESGVLTEIPVFDVYPGGIYLKPPLIMTGPITYHIENTTVNNSAVGISLSETPAKRGFFEGISFTDVPKQVNMTGSAPIFINCSTDSDWNIWISDVWREQGFGAGNASYPTFVNCGAIAREHVDIYYGTSVPPMPFFSESILNVSALVDIIVRDQAGNPIPNAEVRVDATTYDLTDGPDHGNYITNIVVFDGTTDARGIAENVEIPIYSIYGHTILVDNNPDPPSVDQTKYRQTRGDWNTTVSFGGESLTVTNDTTDPIHHDTGTIIVILELKPDFGAIRPALHSNNDPAIAGDVIRFRSTVMNYGSMRANFTVRYYIYNVDNDSLEMIDIFENITLDPSGRWDSHLDARWIEWNTTRNMGDTTYQIIARITDESGYETELGNNEAFREFTLERPWPDLDAAIHFDNDDPTDGDIVRIFATVTNNGKAEAATIHVSFWEGEPNANGSNRIGDIITFHDLDVDDWHEVNLTWDTFNKGNDTIYTESLGRTYVDHDIHVRVEYNNVEDPDPDNTRTAMASETLRVNKFYDLDFRPASQFDYINETVNWTIYAYELKNTGRAMDSFSFHVFEESSNMSNLEYWSYLLSTDTIPDLMAGGGVNVVLAPGASVVIYVNISADWDMINQGELYNVTVTARSVNMTAREMAVNASTSAGTVDYIPTEITFQRADGVRARNRGTTPDSDLKSLVANETSTLTVQIRNAGTAGSRFSFKVTFYEEVDGVPVPIGSTIFSDYIPAGFTQFTSIQHTFTSPGLKTIWAFIDSDEQIGELNETNNWYSTTIYVKEEEAAYDFTISGIVFDWDGNTPLPGATVRLRNTVSGYIDTTVTDGAGKYLLVLDRDFYNDNHPIELSASNPPDPAEDSTIISFYSEDLEVTNVDLYLFVFGVDLTFRPRLGHSVSFIREDGQYSNQPIAGRETIIRFWVVNRGTEGANGTFQITKNGTSSVQLIGDPLETLRWYGPQSVTQVDYVYTFTDPEVVDIDINIVDADGLEIYTVNNLARRTGITIKSKITNMPYDLTGTVYERAGFEDRFAADATVVITNTRTGYSFTTTTDDFGRFTFDLRDLPERYQEGDIIHVRAWKEGVGEGNRTFHAYSEDLGRHIIIVFASYDVRVSASDVRRTVAPGEWTGYQITIFNTGNLNDRFALSLEGEYADWGEFDLADPWIDIRAGSSAMVTLIVDVPEDYATARAGIVATITVVAVSNNGKGPRDSVDTSTTVEQVFEFSLDLDRTLDQGDPGDTIHYTITVTNTGNGRDTLLLGLSGTRIAWAELSPSILTLQPGVPYDVALTVSIPDLARFEDDARFRVTGLSTGGISESTPEIVTGVNEILGVELTVGSPTMYGDPGATVLYSITVHNRGNSQQQMVFTINGPGNGAISVEPTIDGFRSTVVTMSVTIAPQAKANVVYTNLVTASLRDHSTVQSNTISILTVVNEKPGDPVLEVIGTTERTIRPSTSVTFPIRVTNNANIDDTFSFTVENSHPDFFYSIPALAVSSGASGTVDLRITAPSNAVFGDRADLVIRAVSSRGRTSGPGTVTVNVTTYIYGVELSIAGSEKEKKINLGESVSHTFTIRNTGDYRNYSSQISLRITNLNPADADWIIDVPSTMLLPQGEETITASVFVRVPSTTHVGSSISFNVRAMVNLPKSVHGAETNPRYFDEIPGIVTSVNQKPVVSIMTPTGPSYPVYYYRETLEFEADARDPDGRDELLTYDWDFGDGSEVGPGNRVQKPTHSFAFPGTYQVSLTVVDEFGESNTALRTMKIGNRKPDVNAIRTVSGNTVFPKGPVTFIVDVTDEDPNSLDYTWYFGDGTVATISNEILITHTFTRTGPITVTCVAFDEFGGFGSNSLTITIQNNPPVPRFRVIYKDKSYDFDEETTIRITEGDEIAFDASRSSDPDSVHGDRIISYNWIFGDNTNGSGVQPTHIYRDTSRDGFMVSLTVTDSEGMQATITGKIQIEVKEKSDELSLEILALMAVLLAIVLILIIMFLRAPKRMAAIRGMAQTEMADLIKKLNALESKLAFGGAGAVAGSSFAPGPKKFCNTCGTSNEPDGKFCESCGTKLE